MSYMRSLLKTEAGKVGIATAVFSVLMFLAVVVTGSLGIFLIGMMVSVVGGIYTIGLATLEDDVAVLAMLFIAPISMQLIGSWMLVYTGGVPY